MKDCNELRASLADVFSRLKAGEIDTDRASELANLAGKMIQSAKVQVAYYELLKQPADIGFLKDDTKSAGPR